MTNTLPNTELKYWDTCAEIMANRYDYPQPKGVSLFSGKYRYGLNSYDHFSFKTMNFPFGLLMLTMIAKKESYSDGIWYAYLDESVMSDRRGKVLLRKLSKKFDVRFSSCSESSQ